ncbi:MAG: HlyD family efflux transporter periplasmic adaptor subunit, partial [Microcystaceae cyanobacterium]
MKSHSNSPFSSHLVVDDLSISNTLDSPSQRAAEAASIYGGMTGATMPVPQIPARSIPPTPAPSSIADVNNTSRWSPAVHTLLDQPPAVLPQRLIASGIVFCLAFASWAWFGKIDEVGKAQGRLVPQGETYKIEPIELGRVKRIAVKEGDAVKAGQVLVELDTELAEKEVERLQQAITAYYSQLSQKKVLLQRIELEGQTRAAITAAEDLAQRSAIALAKEKAATARQLLLQQQSETAAYRNRQIRLKPLSAVAQERIAQLESDKAAHQQRLARLEPLAEDGAVSHDLIFQAEQQLRETQQRITQSQLEEITSANEQVFQADQSLRDLETRMTQNQGDLSSAFKEAERLQAELAQKQAEGHSMQLESQQKMQQLALEISDTEAKIAEAKNQLASAQAKLNQNYLKAPVDGIVLSLNLKNTGEVVQAGKTVSEIAPNGVPLVLSAILPNQEAGFVKKGMPVQVKLDAYPYQDYGIIPGKVTAISADAKPEKQLGAVYRVEVALDKDYVT